MKQHILSATFFGTALLLPCLTLGQTPDNPAKLALKKAHNELASANKSLGEQSPSKKEAQAKVSLARKKLLAETAWTARQELDKAEEAKKAAEKALAATTKKIKSTKDKVTSATKAAEKAAAEKASATQALEKSPKEQSLKKALAEKSAASEKSDKALVAAIQATGKAAAEKKPAEKLLAGKKAALVAPLDAAAAAHAEAFGGLKPISSKQWDYAKARHLLFRAGFGGNPEEIEKLVKMGPHKAVDYLIEYHKQPRASIEPDRDIYSWERPLAYEKNLHKEAQDHLTRVDGKRNVDQHASMVRWWVKRLIDTPRPAEEKLVLFWHDHFASSYRALGTAYPMYRQNQLLRLYADNYEALLHGIVQDPAMIKFLNNDDNVKGNNNENLGRELLELFSLGEENSSSHIPNGYTEEDVRNGNTRAMTGATFDRDASQYRFYHDKHDGAPKTLLGKKGNWGTHEAVDIMLEHPGTSRYLTKKLWQYYVYWETDPKIIDQMAQVLKENGYRIRPLLKNIFLSEEFYSDKAMSAHIKSPVELLIGTAKIVDLPKLTHQNIRFLLASMGQSLFDPPSVAGWAEGSDWINTTLLLARYTATANLVKEGKADYIALLKAKKITKTEDAVDHLTKRFLLTDLSPDKRQQLIEFLGPLPPLSEWESKKKQLNAKLQALVVLLVSSPEYQVS